MMDSWTSYGRPVRVALLGAMLLAAPGRMVLAQDDITGQLPPAVQREIEYAEALQRMGLPQYADIIIDRLRTQHPEAEARVKVLRLQNLIAVAEWDQIKALIAAEPDPDSAGTWAMKLALADGYFAWGMYGEARGIYNAFFAKYPEGPPRELKDFYINSAYKYAQMLILLDNADGAVKAYERVLKADPPGHVAHQVMAETADLLLKKAQSLPPGQRGPLAKRINTYAEELLWDQGLWFGKGIVLLAHLCVLEGDIEGARRLFEDYRSELQQIDDALRREAEITGEDLTKLSPMAQCRYLLGVLMQEEAARLTKEGAEANRERIIELLAGKKIEGSPRRRPGALQHFLNVFIGYPGTSWAPDAGLRAEEVEAVLREAFGAEITRSGVTPEQMEKVRTYQFRNARALFNQQQFANAVESYIKVLNLFPEGETSVVALGELARCYVELQQARYVDLCVRYLAERFSGQAEVLTTAGDQLIRVAEMYGERSQPMRRQAVYDLFFDTFTKHPMAPALLYQFAERHYAEQDYAGALGYYERITGAYSNAPVYLKALKKITFCHNRLDNPAAEIKALVQQIKILADQDQPGPDYLEARLRLAAAYQQQGDRYLPTALKQYAALEKLLARLDDPRFADGDDDVARNREVLNGVLFYKGVAYTQLKEPEERIPAYRQAAIQVFEKLVAQFPDSAFAPAALSQAGTLYTVLEKPEEAQAAFRTLQERYPQSPEAKNSDFMLGKALLDMGMRRRAVEVFTRMFSGQGDYTPAQILTAGKELLRAGEVDISLQAFERVLQATDEAAYVQHALLGKGKAQVQREEYGAAAETLQRLMDRYPRNALTVEACLQLSRAYAEVARREPDDGQRHALFNKAIDAMNTARGYDTSDGFRARSDVEIGRIQTLKYQVEKERGNAAKARDYLGKAAAAFQLLMRLGNASDPAVRPHMEQAFDLCLPLLLEMERWEDAVDNADRYLELFPDGPHAADVRRVRSRARTQLAVTDASAAPQNEGETP